MGWIFHWRNATDFPVECPGLSPDRLAGLPMGEVARLPARAGRDRVDLADLFRIEATDSADDRLEIDGVMPNLSGLAEGMSGGHLTIRGEVGPWLGSGIRGGTIEVEGVVGDFAGAELRDGLIRIRGDAGDGLGSALPGSRLGMRGGAILVHGSAGAGAGRSMRRGLIAVSGSIGDDPGHRMIAGTLIALGSVGHRAGSGMKRGTLLLMGPRAPELPPGFVPACRQRPTFVAIYRKWLLERDFPIPDPPRAFLRYNGDALEDGRGEILVAGDGGDAS